VRLGAAIAVISGAAACWQARYLMTAEAPRISDPRYLFLVRDLPKGQPIQFADLTPGYFRGTPGELPRGAVTDQDLEWVKGAVLRQAVVSGQCLTFAMLELRAGTGPIGKRIPRGMRAYELEVDRGVRVQAADSIDILSVPSRGEAPTTLVEGAVVLAADRAGGGLAVTVALEPDEVAWVEKAAQTGKLKIALRNPDDEKPPRRPQARRGRRRNLPQRVEVWSEEP
jgi:Flp pilus assembly protein CpaB